MPGTRIRSADRVLDVLELLAEAPGGEASLKDIAAALDLHPTTAYHTLATLRERGVLAQDPRSRRYRLGPRAFWLASAILGTVDLLRAARPAMRDFAARTGEAITLSVLDGEWVLGLDRVSPRNLTPGFADSPRRAPVYCTALGKVLASGLTDDRVLEILRATGMPPRTPNTRRTPQEFLAELVRVRAEGVAYDHEEWQAGFVCVAAPVHDFSSQILAALSSGGQAVRMQGRHLAEVTDALRETARAISRELGYREEAGPGARPHPAER